MRVRRTNGEYCNNKATTPQNNLVDRIPHASHRGLCDPNAVEVLRVNIDVLSSHLSELNVGVLQAYVGELGLDGGQESGPRFVHFLLQALCCLAVDVVPLNALRRLRRLRRHARLDLIHRCCPSPVYAMHHSDRLS